MQMVSWRRETLQGVGRFGTLSLRLPGGKLRCISGGGDTDYGNGGGSGGEDDGSGSTGNDDAGAEPKTEESATFQGGGKMTAEKCRLCFCG